MVNNHARTVGMEQKYLMRLDTLLFITGSKYLHIRGGISAYTKKYATANVH